MLMFGGLSYYFPSHRASVFLVFNFKPEQTPNLSSVMERHSKDWIPCKIVVRSSAKTGNLISLFSTIIPFMFLSCRILISKSSRATMKRYADSGSPCLTPLHTSNIWVENPLFRMHLDILQYRTETHEINELPKLNEFNALKRKVQLSESKAFSKSNATTSPGICLISAYSIISSIVRIASNIVLPLA